MIHKLLVLLMLLALLALSLFSNVIDAELTTFAWERGDNQAHKGFRIYYGEQSEVYDNHIEVGNVTRITVDIPLIPAYVAATAFSDAGESDYSNEVYIEEVTPQYEGASNLIVSQYCDEQAQPPTEEVLQVGKDYEMETLSNGAILLDFNRSFGSDDVLDIGK